MIELNTTAFKMVFFFWFYYKYTFVSIYRTDLVILIHPGYFLHTWIIQTHYCLPTQDFLAFFSTISINKKRSTQLTSASMSVTSQIIKYNVVHVYFQFGTMWSGRKLIYGEYLVTSVRWIKQQEVIVHTSIYHSFVQNFILTRGWELGNSTLKLLTQKI